MSEPQSDYRARKPKRPFRLSEEQRRVLATHVESAEQQGYDYVKVRVRGKMVKATPCNEGKPESF